ncbi:hypothetical protein ACOMHN_008507 [Nucella lapillus]
MRVVRATATSRAVTRPNPSSYQRYYGTTDGTLGDPQSPQTVPRSKVPLPPATSQRPASYYPEITLVSAPSASVNPVPTDEEIDEFVSVSLEDSRSPNSSYYGSLGDWPPNYRDMPMSHQERQGDVLEDLHENWESSRCCLVTFCIIVPLVIVGMVVAIVIYFMPA